MARHLRYVKGNLAMQAVVLFVVLISDLPVMLAQNGENYKVVYKQIPDNRGTEFVVAFMQQYQKKLDGATRLFITSDYNTRAVLTSKETNVRKELEIKARELYPVDFPTSVRMESTKIEEKGILIKAENEIVVYGLNIKKYTTDAFLALPVDIQSTKYIVPSFTPSQASLIGIVGIYDRTIIFVTFQFSSRTSSLKFRGRVYRHRDTLSVTLSRLQTFQIAHADDMTGTRIFSTKPISVFSGNECANVPREKGYCDHLVEHIPPVNTWGQRFITAPLAGRRGGDFFRILAANYSTDVRINGKYVKTLNEGKYIEVDVPSDRYQYIETSKPCLVLQFSKGRRVDSTSTDPFMIMIPPVEQYTAQYTVSTPDQNEQYFESYINIIIDTKQIDGLRLDGRSLRDHKWVPVWGTTHSAARIAVTHGVHRVMHDSPIVPFAIFLYGYARADSYGYPGGLRLADLTLQCVPGNPGDGLDNDCDRRIDEEIANFIDDDADGRIDEDLVSEPPEIVLDVQTAILEGCPAIVKRKLKEPKVIVAPLCSGRGPFKLSFVDNTYERDCVQYIERMWLVRDGCGNLANATQQIRIRRPQMRVTFPENVRGKCHVGEDMTEVGEPVVKMSCKEDRFSVKYRDTPALVECIRRGRTIGREWTVKASCGTSIKHMQKLLPDITPPKINFVGKLQYRVKRNFRISWNASEESTFECSLDGPNNPRPCGSGLGETWSKRGIPDGKQVFWVRATDLAGNTGAYIRHPFEVDNSGPRLDFVRPLKNLSQGPMAIKWKSNEMARFKCGLNPDRMEQCGSGTEGKEYRRDLQDGTYTFYVGAVDQIGNEARIIKHLFRIDSTPPRIKFGKTVRPTVNSRVDLPLLSNEPAKFYCSLDDGRYTACGDGLKGRFVARNLVEGPHELKVKAVDEAGNVADPISLKWNSDKTSPNILFTPGLPTKFRERPKVTWTSTEYAKFECSLDDNARFRPCGRGSRGQWTKNEVPAGVHDFFVRGTDRHGNVGPTESFRFSIDNKHPILYLSPPLPKTTASPTATFRWTSNEMAFFKCAVDDTTNFKDCGSGTRGDWTTPSLSNGKHTFYLTAKDEVGNTAPRLSHTWNIDNIAPVLKFTGILPDDVNKNKQTFRWTSSEFAKFTCYIDSDTNSVPCGEGNKGSWTSNELDDGPHTFRVVGTDPYGNQGPPIQHTWDIDTKAPTVNLAKIPENINKPKTKFTWKSTEPAKFSCALDNNEAEPCGQGTDGEYLTPTLADGEHEFRLLVEDMVGNLAPLIRSKFNVDTSLPVITFDKPNPSTPQRDLDVTWKSSEDSEFECALDDPNLYEACGEGKTGALQRDDLPDGKHKLYVRGKDEVGNVGRPSVYTVTTDRSPPSMRFTDQYKPLSKKPSETFTWTSDELVTFKCKVDEGEEKDCGQGTEGEFRTPDLPDGEHVFQVTPIDIAGNKGKMLERKWIKDSTAPDVRYTSQPPKVSRATVTFKWASSEEAEFDCALDDTNQASSCGSGTTGAKTLSNIPKGARVFWVRGTDKAGNVGQFVPHYWTVDTNPPGIEFIGDLPSFSKKSLKFRWKSDEDSRFECALNDMKKFASCGNGMRGNKTLRGLKEGNHTFYVRARDQLDNVGKPISHSWTVDSVAPRAVLDPVSPVVATPRITLSWKADEISKFLCAIGDAGNVIECGQGTTGSWTTPYLRRGPQKFWLIAEDYTGNRAEPVSVGWTVDNKAPVVTFSNDSTQKSSTKSPRFSWTSDEPAKFECAIEGVTQFENCGTGTSSTWTGSNVPDGKQRFLVRARDDYGNQNNPYSFPFEVDTTPPTGFAVTGPPRRTNKPQAKFTWRSSEDAKFECYVDGVPTDCGEGTSGKFTTDILPDGEHDFKVEATDDHGNKAPVVNSKWSIDTSGPQLKFPRNLPRTTLSNPWFNWTSDEPARFDCSMDGQSNWEYCGSGKSGVWQKYNVPDGKHDFSVRGTDDLGNTGPTITHPFKVDFTAPRIRITSPPDKSSPNPTIRWSSTEDVKFECSFDDGEFEHCGDGTTGSWTKKNVPDGPHAFVVQGKDEVGNTGRFTYSWSKDSSGPSLRFKGNPPKYTLGAPTFSWTSSEPAIFECSLDGFINIEKCGSGVSGTWQRFKPDGKYELSVRGKDGNGNTGIPIKHEFTVDNTAPTIKIATTSDLDSSRPNIRWTSDEDIDFKCSYDGGQFLDCGNGRTGSWTGKNVPDGRHKLVIQGKDPVDNTGTHTFTWTKDSSGPAVEFDGDLPNVTLSTPRFSWTSSEPAVFECSLDGFNSIENCGSGTFGTWQRFKPDGKYELSVRGKDSKGNTGTPIKHEFTVDNTAPTLKITSRPDITSPNPTIKWSASEDVRFECSLDYKDFFYCGEDTTGSWTGNNIPDGSHTFVIRGKDEVGHTGRYSYRWTQDSVAPVVSFNQLPDQADSSPRFRWTSTEPAIFECSLDGANYQECGRGYDGVWQKSRVPGGEHTFSVRGKDASGNIGEPTNHTWRIDATGPVVTLNTPRLTQNRASFTWRSNKLARFECAMNDQTRWEYCGSGIRGSRPYYNLPDGKHTFYVRGQDARRNIGSPASVQFTVDGKPPDVTVNSSQTVYSTRSPAFTWDSSEDATFECTIDNTRFYEACGEGTSGQWTASNVPDGRHAFFIRGKDKSGNYGPHVRHLFTVDTRGPQAYITSNLPRTTRNPKLTLTWLSNEDATFECTIDGKKYDCGSGTQGRFTTPSLRDGKHTFTMTPVDKVGNRGKPVIAKWETDSSSPEIQFDPNLPQKTSRNAKASWTSSEFAYFECDLDNQQQINCGRGTSWDMTFGVSRGPHTLSVRGTDRYGNVGQWKKYSFEVDADGPQISFPSDQPRVTKSSPTFNWNSSEHAKFRCGVDSSFNLVDCGEGDDGQWTGENIPDGQHVFVVVGTDDLGNQGPFAQHRFTVDNSVPIITFQRPATTTNSNPQMRWTSSENAQFECSLDGAEYENCGSGFNGFWTQDNIPDGKHTFSVRGRDSNGNVGLPNTLEWNVDSKAPTLSITSNNPSETSSPRQIITWDSSEPAQFECKLDGQDVECGEGTSGVFTTPNMPDGKHTFSVNAVDSVSNRGTPKIVKWSTDKRAPVLSITSNNKPSTSNPRETITWDSNEQAQFECRLDGLLVNCGSGTSGKYTTPDLPDGKHTFSVNGVDSVGNKGIPKVVTWLTDKRAPTLRITSNNPPRTNNRRQIITWDSSESADFECKLDGQVVDCGSGTSGIYTTPNLPDGKHTFSVNAVDSVGNRDTPKIVKWSTDKQAPVLSFTSNNERRTSNPRETITWDSNEQAQFECRLDGQLVNCGSGTSGKYTTPDLPDGKHTFSVSGVDSVGNKGVPKMVTWITDKRGPALRITSNNPPRTNNRRQIITWESSESADFECKLDGQVVDCGSGTSGIYTTPNLPDGKHTFSVNAVDSVGNKGTPQVVTWSTDKRPPTLTITSNNPPNTNDKEQTITWDSNEQAVFECRLDGLVVDCGSGTSGEFTTPDLADGQHTFSVNAVDDLGNKGTPQVVSWSTDTKGPRVQIVSSVPPQTNKPKTKISWTSNERGIFECILDNIEVDCGNGTSGQYSTSELPDGKHSFSVRSVDSLGNKGKPEKVNWEIDSTAPDITFPSTLPKKTKANPRITWTSSEYSTFECALDDQSRSIRCRKGTSSYWSGINIPHGPHTFWVRGTDNQGNVGEWKPYEFEVDSTGPDITFADQPKTMKNNPTIKWSSSEPATFKCRMEDSFNEIDCGEGNNGQWSKDQIPDGPHKLLVYGVDKMNNRGPVAELEFNVDATGPKISFPADAPVLTKNNPKFTWKSSEFAKFKCGLDDGQSSLVDCGEGTNGRWTGKNIPDGQYKFLVFGTDDMNNKGPIAEHSFTVDNSAPSLTFNNPDKVTDAFPRFTWRSQEEAQFECSLDGAVFKNCGSGRNGAWSGIDIPHGKHVFAVRGRDKNGNVGEPIEHTWNVDTKPPNVEIQEPFPKATSSDAISIRWTSDETARYLCAVDNSSPAPCGFGKDANWRTPMVDDGDHVFSLTAEDLYGNTAPVVRRRWTVDTSGPKISFPANQPTLTRNNPTFTWTSSEPAKFKCGLDDGRLKLVDCGNGTNGQWTATNIPDGPYNFIVYGTDELNNRGPNAVHKFTVDASPPQLTFSGNLPETTTRNPRLTWTSNEFAKFECRLDDGPVFNCESGKDGSWTGRNLRDGPHSLYVRGTDRLGNKGKFISRSWSVDESGPILRFTGPVPSRARRFPRIRWLSNEYASFECSLNGRKFTRCGTGLRGSWTKDEIPKGLQVFSVRGRDSKGNVGEPISVTIEIDTTAPTIELLKPLPTKTKKPTWTFLWTADELANFTCAVDSIRDKVDCGFGMNGRFTTEPLSDGQHSFYLLGEDELGNTARIVKHRWVVDKTKPEIEFLPNQPKVSDADITLLWKTTANKPAEFECALDNIRYMQPCGKGTTGSWTNSNVPDGDHTLYVRAKDSFGDYGKIKSHTWQVDTKVPRVRLYGMPPKRSVYNSGSFFWDSDEKANYVCAIDLAESGTPCGSGIRSDWVSDDLDDGEHTFYLRATDINGNQADPIQYKWEIDTEPPIVTLDENTERVSGNNVTLKWRTNENAVFTCAVDSIFDNRDCGDGRASQLKMKNLEDGPHTVWIKAVDELGNLAPWKKHTWIVDSKPPELDFTSKLPNKTSGDVSFFWKSKELAKFECGTNPNNLVDCGIGDSGNWSTQNLTDGEHEFFVEATDEFGNKIRIGHRWVVDNKPPILSWRRKVPDVTGKHVRFRWQSDEKANFFCAHEDINDLEECSKRPSLRGNWLESNLPEGKHRVWIIGKDEVGNQGKPLHHEWIVDTKGPTLFFNQPVPKKSGASVQFSWRSNEDAKFSCAFDHGDTFTPCGDGFEGQLRIDNMKRSAQRTLHVRGVDAHGNVGDNISTTWIVDLIAPVLVDVGPLPRLTNKNPVITWRVNEEAVFECALDNLDDYKWCGNGTKGEWRGKDLPKGDHRIVVRVKDPQGNSNPIIDHKFVVGIPDNRGREFILAFMQQYLRKKTGDVSLFITSDNHTVATIYIPGLGQRRKVELQPDELVRVDLDVGVRMSGTQKEKKGILVTAENELVVYGLNTMPYSTDAYLALPTDIQGTEYYAVSYTVSKNSIIAIVGIEDKTVVYITLKMSEDIPLRFGESVYRNGDTMIIEIDRLETFQLTHTRDLTGTRVASDKVISVYSGNECANVPADKGYCDHLVEMLTPTSTWGRRFVTAPFFSRKSGDFFRVVASQDDTLVVFHPSDQEYLQAGEFMERDVPSDEYKFITATKPCMLMQYSKGADTDDTNTDPFLILIPPIEQYGSHYILSTPDRPEYKYFQSYINVIVLTDQYKGVLVDGNPAYKSSKFKTIPGTPYSASAVRVSKGVHRVDHVSPIVTFGAFMYGFAWRDSYGYPGGLRLADITGVCTGVDTPADGMDNDCDRRIDEELKNGLDDDGDGRIDEDLATFPPTIELDQPYYEYESCVFEVDALVPRPKATSSAECNFKGALRMTKRDRVVEHECTHLINRTWQASDGCGNVVYLNQIIKITRPKMVVRFPRQVPNGCAGSITLRVTGSPQVESPCKIERVRVGFRDNISKKDCQEKGMLLERHFTISELCGREYKGVQRIFPGARS